MKLGEHIKQLEINGLTFIEKAFSVKDKKERSNLLVEAQEIYKYN